jgi:(2Fe-2S) ferredoxin
MSPDGTVIVCGGKSCCKKESCAFVELCERLEAAAVPVQRVDCLGVCDGPVAGVCEGGRVVWFGRLRKAKAQRDLVAVAAGGAPTGRLDKRMLGKSARAKATSKARKALERQGRAPAGAGARSG